MKRLAILGVVALMLALATPVAAAGPPDGSPAIVVKVEETSFPICLTPTPLCFWADSGAYSGHIVFQPLVDLSIWPHGQMENSRFDFTWTGELGLGINPYFPDVCAFPTCVPVLTLADAAEEVSGHMMVHLHRPLPNDTGEIVLPDGTRINVGVPTTPYSISIVLDEPVQVLPDLLPYFEASQLQLTKGRLLFVK